MARMVRATTCVGSGRRRQPLRLVLRATTRRAPHVVRHAASSVCRRSHEARGMSSALGGDHSLSMVEIITLPLHTRARAGACGLASRAMLLGGSCAMLHRIVLYCVAVGRRTTRSFQPPSPCEFHATRCCTHELNARSHARTHARAHAHSRTLAHTLALTHARTHACTHLHAYTHTRTHACTHAYTHACTRARSHLFAFAFGRRSSTACAFATEPTCVASWGICNMVRLLHVALSCNQQGELQ